MARASVAAENAATNAVAGLAAFVAPHTGDPGTTGASELAGDTRQSVTWGAASGGSAANTNTVNSPLPGNVTIGFVGYWSLVAGGTYEIGAALTASVSTGATPATLTFAPGALTLAAS